MCRIGQLAIASEVLEYPLDDGRILDAGDHLEPPAAATTDVIIAHGLTFGIGFGLRAAIFMGMTNPLVAATQFTTFMAMGNLATSIANFWQGRVAERLDYSVALYVDALLVMLPLAIVPFLRPREPEGSIVQAAEVPAID
jgi:hypothetical protein